MYVLRFTLSYMCMKSGAMFCFSILDQFYGNKTSLPSLRLEKDACGRGEFIKRKLMNG